MTDIPVVWIVAAAVIVILLVRRYRGRRRSAGHSASGGGVDVEADLLQACHGDRALAERLIAHELERHDDLSRTGAALMALAKLRDDQR
jgi:hypothetical protein